MQTFPLTEIPLVGPGDDLSELFLDSLGEQGIEIEDGDVIVVAQAVVSKAEGRVVDLNDVSPSPRAERLSERVGKDPRKVEVILGETEELVRSAHVLITRTEHGFVCADAGVDGSNVRPDHVTVLPEDPDGSADRIRRGIRERTGKEVGVVVSDSWGRPFRLGALGFAIGISGLGPLEDLRGSEDVYGEELTNTTFALPDALAAAASLEMGEGDERVPAVLFKGISYEPGEGGIDGLMRPKDKDLFG